MGLDFGVKLGLGLLAYWTFNALYGASQHPLVHCVAVGSRSLNLYRGDRGSKVQAKGRGRVGLRLQV